MRRCLLAALLFVPSVAFAQTTVYSNDFEVGPLGPEWSGAGSRQTTGGLSAFGFGATHLKNDGTSPSTLSLTGLGSHTSLTLSFFLAMWDSIDFGSDKFVVTLDGTTVLNQDFGNYFPAQCEGPGTRITEDFTAFAVPNYGYNAGFRDCGRSVSLTFAHSATSAVLGFAFPASQGAPDESFGIDNVVIQTNAIVSNSVPEPGTYALMATGLLGILAVRRRARRA